MTNNDNNASPPFAEDPWKNNRTISLCLAVVFYGLAAQSPHAKPARPDTVLSAADDFCKYLDRYQRS